MQNFATLLTLYCVSTRLAFLCNFTREKIFHTFNLSGTSFYVTFYGIYQRDKVYLQTLSVSSPGA